MRFNLFGERGRVVASLSGELDHHRIPSIQRIIDEKIEECGAEELVLDFAGVDFMDSSGIGFILGRMQKMEDRNGRMILKNAPLQVERVLQIARKYKMKV